MDRSNTQILGRQLAEARRDVQRLESTLANEKGACAALLQERDAMLRSRSWRLTAPLRWLVAKLQRGSAGPAVHAPVATAVAGDEGMAAKCGLLGLPAGLRRPQLDDLEAANATCRMLNLYPGLEGVVQTKVLHALDGLGSEPGDEYLGWRDDAPAIGFIGSAELRTELSFDAKVAMLDEANWRTRLVPGALRFLIIETVWHVEHRNWRYAFTSEGDRSECQHLLDHCKAVGLPVIVWFRETPGNYRHFAWLAGQADLVCVADAEVAAQLHKDFPEARIEYLPPAIQPALHNPLRSCGLMGAADALRTNIVFDGWWDLHNGLAELPRLHELKAHGLLVAESHWDFGKVRLADCAAFENFTIGCLGWQEKLVMNRLQGAEVFAAAPLAGGWRSELGMARAAASGAMVLRLDGNEPWLPELRLPDDTHGEGPLAGLLKFMADPLLHARRGHLAWRRLMSAHTIAHRLQYMADKLSIKVDFIPSCPRIACLLVTMRPDRLEECIRRFRSDLYPNKELVIVIHGDDVDIDRYRILVHEGEPIRFFRAGKSLSLGACLNFAVSQTDAPYWTKVDDDDLYGANYLSDVMLYQQTGQFDVFGKPPMFNYLESRDELLWDAEWARHANLVHEATKARSALVAGGTLGGHRRVLEAIPFSERRRGGSDSDFIRHCYEAGLNVLSMDGFNFVRCRSAQPGFHTWSIDEQDIRLRSRRVGGLVDSSREALC
ncbi:glycosyltransferase [Stenotrophomonas daejeonensis]|nr:glycosyltransferase [Stenotrophomonas daejeonensis]